MPHPQRVYRKIALPGMCNLTGEQNELNTAIISVAQTKDSRFVGKSNKSCGIFFNREEKLLGNGDWEIRITFGNTFFVFKDSNPVSNAIRSSEKYFTVILTNLESQLPIIALDQSNHGGVKFNAKYIFKLARQHGCASDK